MKRFLLVTEKSNPRIYDRDGGAHLVNSLKRMLGDSVDVLQFDENPQTNNDAKEIRLTYPNTGQNRFIRRLQNASFVADHIHEVCKNYECILFVHVSMQFGLVHRPLNDIEVITFPMFLTPSYERSTEKVPVEYTRMERLALAGSSKIITPSIFERRQLMDYYNIPSERIIMIPRGIDYEFYSDIEHLSDHGKISFCSIGSIKPQKNTVGLLHLFRTICDTYPNARLKIIGPIQDTVYGDKVFDEIDRLNLAYSVELLGYLQKKEIRETLSSIQIHISASNCETFGRAIFETLSAGVPNICKSNNNAAQDFLNLYPCAKFYSTDNEALSFIETIMKNYPALSRIASRVGSLYDDKFLMTILHDELIESEKMIVSDFDGTLYHKTDSFSTLESVKVFMNYSTRVVCSSRPIDDLLRAMKEIGVDADYVVAWSGAVGMDRSGNILWVNGFGPKDEELGNQLIAMGASPIEYFGEHIQYTIAEEKLECIPLETRVEVYQGQAFVSKLENTKLFGIQKLIKLIDWRGRIDAFGDNRYDLEFLNYFDGTLCKNKLEVNYNDSILLKNLSNSN